MRIVSIDTSTSLASVAIAIDQQIVAETVFSVDRTLSARLLPEIERMLVFSGLAVEDIELFASAIGPGSFTGVRAGIATIQGLALATGRPCAGFSTLALLSMNFVFVSMPVCTLLDARKNEVYAALYDTSASLPYPIINDCVMPPEHFLDLVCYESDMPVIFVGEGALRYRDLISYRMGVRAIFAPFTKHSGLAANGTLLAHEAFLRGEAIEPAKLLPVYLRKSEAEYAKMDRQHPLAQ
jgi:tRNA threonylcarbamoyladenosine biosynthesis protein TsaB